MADIPVTVSALGATEAAKQIRDTAKATLAAAAADDKLTRSSKAVADQRKRETEAEKSLAAERKRTANESRSVIQRGAALGGAGRLGAGLGALAGGGAMTTGGAAAFTGVTLFTSAISVLDKALERSQKLAIQTADAISRDTVARIQSKRTLESNALSVFKQEGQNLGRLGVLGGASEVGTAKAIADDNLTTFNDAVNGMLILAKAGVTTLSQQNETAEALRTGLLSFSEAAEIQAKAGGGLKGRDIVSEFVGRSFSQAEFDSLKSRAKENGTVTAMRAITGERNRVTSRFIAEPSLAVSGAKAAASESLSPGTRALLDAFAANAAKLDQMIKLAEDQALITKVWQNLKSENGSLQVQVIRSNQEAAANAGLPQPDGIFSSPGIDYSFSPGST